MNLREEVPVMDNSFGHLLEMEDYRLISEVRDAIIDEIRNLHSEDDLEKIPDIKFYLITASIFDIEMQNGGLCQFLVNEGNFHGPMLVDALCAFGAEHHGRMIAEFCKENGIDLSNLQELLPENVDPYCMTENYLELLNKYPFDEFDKAYFEIDRECPLEGILGEYIRKNILQFQER